MDPHKKMAMTRDKKGVDYPVELESQFILRLPEEPAKSLREVLRLEENFKNRLSIQMENDMRHGEVRFDDWLLHAKVVDLPTIVESMKTIDRKSVYKSADICQMMVCKTEIDLPAEEETPVKNKKKDPFKVDKKFLFPHGITPPTKNVRKRRFRKTLKKKSVEAPEIEKEVKRLLRADNEAVSFTWEIIEEAVKDEPDNKNEPNSSVKPEKVKTKKEKELTKSDGAKQSSSKVEDIFGGTLSDSDLEDENVNVDPEDSRLSTYEDTYFDTSMQSSDFNKKSYATEFSSDMFCYPQSGIVKPEGSPSKSKKKQPRPSTSTAYPYALSDFSQASEGDKLQQLAQSLEELKQRKQKTQQEIASLENMTLRQRFQEILQNINKEIAFKEMEYQTLSSYK